MLKKLFPLSIGGLAIGTTEFVIMGLFRNIGESMHLNDSQTGHFISAYALGVVVGAPLLVAITSKFNPKKVLLGLMLLFTIFNGISALMPNYTTFLLARFFAGLPHGAFFGIGAIVAKTLGGRGKEASAIAIMFGGLTFANLAMVPFFTYIGNIVGWRWAMGVVALLGILTFISVLFFLPSIHSERNDDIKKEISDFFNIKSSIILGITALGCGGLFAWFSYIEPLMLETAMVPKSQMPAVMITAGVGMVAGNFFGGWLADKIRPIRAIIFILTGFIVVLSMVFLLSSHQAVAWGLTFICGAASMSLGAPLNIMMFKASPRSQMMGAAFMQAAFNVANSLGAYFGGIPRMYDLPTNYPSLVGAIMVAVGLFLCLFLSRKYGKDFQ